MTNTKPSGRWRDGRRFAGNVKVWNGHPDLPTSHCMYRLHRARALAVCLAGEAEPVVPKGRGEIVNVVALALAPTRKAPPSRPGLHNYQGQRTVFQERLGDSSAYKGLKCYTLKELESWTPVRLSN